MEQTQEYLNFIEKFEIKRTTDDCYTPPLVYEAVADWVMSEYNVKESQIVRPFIPGGDYKTFAYESDSVVVDNPPFSILSEIVKYYDETGRRYFLFCPALVCAALSKYNATIIAVHCTITYANGANVATSFVTNLEPEKPLIRSAPKLYNMVKEAVVKSSGKEILPKYEYPPEVLTTSMVSDLSHCGIDYELPRYDGLFIRQLDEQKAAKKSIYGAGWLISRDKARERVEKTARGNRKKELERMNAKTWMLSPREKLLSLDLGVE